MSSESTHPAAAAKRCRLLEWDSQFFGCRIGRVEGSHLTMSELDGILGWCASMRIDCLYFLAESGSQETVEAAEKAGFGLKDLRVTLERKLSPGALENIPQSSAGALVRLQREDDTEALVQIARGAHTDSRFFFDRRFDRALVESLYATWIRKACEGNAASVFVAEINSEPAGYLTCEFPAENTGQLGLFAVSPRYQGQGVGRALLNTALHWFADRGATSISVVTQGRNVAAQSLYQGAGFRTRSLQCWYHKWFRES